MLCNHYILGGPEGRAVATRSLVCGQGQPTKGAQTKAPSLPRHLSVKVELVVQILETWMHNSLNSPHKGLLFSWPHILCSKTLLYIVVLQEIVPRNPLLSLCRC